MLFNYLFEKTFLMQFIIKTNRIIKIDFSILLSFYSTINIKFFLYLKETLIFMFNSLFLTLNNFFYHFN